MEMRTIYKLHPGDTIYLVTPEGEIKTITLNKQHFELVDKMQPNFWGAISINMVCCIKLRVSTIGNSL